MSDDYKPAGYCPKCSYATDVGVCPECGYDIPSGKLHRQPWAVRRRRIVKRAALVVGLLAIIGAGYTMYRAGWWVRPLPTDWLITLASWESPDATAELAERTLDGKLSNAELQRLIDEVFLIKPVLDEPPEQWAAYPRDYPISILGDLDVPPPFQTLTLAYHDAELHTNGELFRRQSNFLGNTSKLTPGSPMIGTRVKGLPPGEHDMRFDYTVDLLSPRAGGKPIGTGLQIPVALSLTVMERDLADLITLVRDDAQFRTMVAQTNPSVRLMPAENRLRLEFTSETVLGARVTFALRAADGTFRPLAAWNFGLSMIVQPANRSETPACVGNMASGGWSGDRMRMKLEVEPEFVAEILATGGFDLRIGYDAQETRELGFELGQSELIVGEAIIPGVIEDEEQR
jgi:hypothetical protein